MCTFNMYKINSADKRESELFIESESHFHPENNGYILDSIACNFTIQGCKQNIFLFQMLAYLSTTSTSNINIAVC